MFYKLPTAKKIVKAFSPYLEDTIEINVGIVETLMCKSEMWLKLHIDGQHVIPF